MEIIDYQRLLLFGNYLLFGDEMEVIIEELNTTLMALRKPMTVTLTQHIEITPDTRNGKPRIAGSRITVAEIAIMYLKMGQSLELIAGKYHLSLASVYAAMSYYYEHQGEIEQQIAENEALSNEFQKNNPSRLQEKLRTLRGE